MSTSIVGHVLLNQYRVDDFIASGGMGVVFRVWDFKRNVPLAMKVLHTDLADDPSILKRFKREANALKKLTHPNIVDFYGLQQDRDLVFILEAFIDGPSLKDILRQRKNRPLSLNETLIYTRAMCAALGYAHVHGVVHCDVKPGNVMIDRGGLIYLTDFGIARHAESTTTTLGTAGTPAYMAPEQIRGEPVSPTTDVYALGVLMFELLTGLQPFRGNERGTESAGQTAAERTRYAHLHLQPPSPHSLNLAVPDALELVVLKALVKDPKERYQSTQELYLAYCEALNVSPATVVDRLPWQESDITKLFAVQAGMSVAAPMPGSQSWSQEVPLSQRLKARMGILIAGGGAGLLVILFLSLWSPWRNAPVVVPTAQSAVIFPTRKPSSEVVTEQQIIPTSTPTSEPSATPTIEPTPNHTLPPLPTPSQTPQIDPITIEPYCEKYGDSPTYVQENQHIVLWWRWDAASPEFIDDHLRTATYEIYLDGQRVFADSQNDIQYVSSGGFYRVSWSAHVGVLAPGIHRAGRSLSWSQRISDGWDTFGPGGRYETLWDECEINVE